MVVKTKNPNYEKKAILLFTFLFLTLFSQAQKPNNQIGITPFVRWDNYPRHTYHYNGAGTSDNLKMKGTSYGIDLDYKFNVKKGLFIKAGIGYYKYKLDKLDNDNSVFGKSQARPINFISPLFIQLSTDKYYYNNLFLTTGIEKQFELNKGFNFITSFNLNGYFTYSQYYHLTANPNDGNLNFNKNEKGFLSVSGNVMAAVTKKVGSLQIGPSLFIPVFDVYKKDPVFLETGSRGGNSKLLNGIGLGLVCNVSLH